MFLHGAELLAFLSWHLKSPCIPKATLWPADRPRRGLQGNDITERYPGTPNLLPGWEAVGDMGHTAGPERRHGSRPAKRRIERKQTKPAASPMQLSQVIFSWKLLHAFEPGLGAGRATRELNGRER
jgi:hypothetical protein